MSESQSPAAKVPTLSNGAYDKLKHTAALVLPAAAAFYIGLGNIWHFPKIEEVAGSIAVLNTILGGFLGVSTRLYNNSGIKYTGKMVVDDSGPKTVVSFDVPDPEKLLKMPEVTFKVSTDTGEVPIVKNP